MVPEDRRLRAGRRARPRRRRLERAPVPRQLGVLRRLRALPRRDHAAARASSSAPPASAPRASTTATARPPTPTSRPTCTTSPGRRRRASSRSRAASTRPAEVSAQDYREAAARLGRADRGAAPRRRRGAAAHAARAPAAGGALLCGRRMRSTRLRPGLRPLSVPHADHRRSAGGGDRHRRDGVPDLHHRPARSRSFNTWPFDRVYLPEIVVAHEFAHQYFQGLVGLERVRGGVARRGHHRVGDRWLVDELVGRRSIGPRAGRPARRRPRLPAPRQPPRPRPRDDPPAVVVATTAATAFNAYARPSLTLRTLEGLLGSRTMARVMRTYAERWRFRHPSSDDFYRVASEVAGRDLTPFFRQTIESPAVIDYAVGEIAQEPAHTAVTVRREGDLQIPIVVAFKFAGRPVERRTWDGVARWTRFTFGYAGAARVGRRRPRSHDRPRRLVAEQRARGRRRSPRAGGDDVALAARRAAGPVVAGVLATRASGVARDPRRARRGCGRGPRSRSWRRGRS